MFLAGLGKGQNREDERQRVVMHNRYGIGMAAFYPEENRIHRNTLLRKAIAREIRRETVAEELRILYVAMTRAKEKLILIGTDDLTSPLALGARPTYRDVLDAPHPLAWIRMANAYTQAIREIPIGEEALALHTVRAELQKEPALAEVETLLATGKAGTYAADLHAFLTEKQRFSYDRAGMNLHA